jgi:hypothetical protein
MTSAIITKWKEQLILHGEITGQVSKHVRFELRIEALIGLWQI